MKIAVLASGGLGLKCVEHLFETNKLEFIATDSASFSIIEFAKKNNIPCFKGNPRKGRLSAFVGGIELDILFSVNYLFIIEPDIISIAKFPINFHGSLLPKYRGRTPHVWSIINNEKQTGVTAHLINEDCDTGDVLLQESIQIGAKDTGNDILQKYVSIYPAMIDNILENMKNGALKAVPQNHSLATFFDKRTPEDGLINWNWQKERINNWIRAQAYPYPGAFTYHGNTKLIIDKIEFSDFGYQNLDTNGKILFSDEKMIIVKTPNGAVELVTIRNIGEFEVPLNGTFLSDKNS